MPSDGKPGLYSFAQIIDTERLHERKYLSVAVAEDQNHLLHAGHFPDEHLVAGLLYQQGAA
ncbi:hypothetical protein ACCAA_340035 [Candidatus Accumulibacter aalborgensis]|uniref:Uncharacterized protein n=1 Tax=Candidatus Accumulibacter aalborgensis TaxID=1860102 RepID=A0A1A8XRD2_9PROT|nr:hypothetical protein ACCAA_340035 [Candidatus Accumulibacter aalborgensis]